MSGVLDPAALDTLRELGGEEFLTDLVSTFQGEAQALLDELEEALRGGDAESARRAAHTLKSNAATFGAGELAELSRVLEERAKAGELHGSDAIAARAREEYARVAAELASLGGSAA